MSFARHAARGTLLRTAGAVPMATLSVALGVDRLARRRRGGVPTGYRHWLSVAVGIMSLGVVSANQIVRALRVEGRNNTVDALVTSGREGVCVLRWPRKGISHVSRLCSRCAGRKLWP